MAEGIVDSDGKYSLSMAHRSGVMQGAPEGSYTVAFYFPANSVRNGERVELSETLTVEPRENYFKINLPTGAK